MGDSVQVCNSRHTSVVIGLFCRRKCKNCVKSDVLLCTTKRPRHMFSVLMVSACYSFKVKLIVALFTFFCVYMVPFNSHT